MAAATAYMNKCSGEEFARASNAWAGVLLCKGAVYVDTRANQRFLSLGFNKWVAIAVSLECHDIGGTHFFRIRVPRTA
jgi:hypothetical protein